MRSAPPVCRVMYFNEEEGPGTTKKVPSGSDLAGAITPELTKGVRSPGLKQNAEHNTAHL